MPIPKKIAFIVSRSDTIGGSLVHVRDFAHTLPKYGMKGVIITGNPGPFTDQLDALQIDYVSLRCLSKSLNPIYTVPAYRELKIAIKNLQPDLISTHSAPGRFLGGYVAKSLGIPILSTAHGWACSDGRPLLTRILSQWLERWAVKRSDRVITVSEYDRIMGIERLGIPEPNIHTIHNGMFDIDEEQLANPGQHGKVHITMIARMDHQKNHSLLLKALSGLSNYHLHLVGDGPLEDNYKELVAILGINDSVTFHGRLNDVIPVLKASHLFVLISNWEGFPRSTLEAMRAGLPVIISDSGGAAEAVDENITGFILRSNKPNELARDLKKLLRDPELRKKMGIAGRERFINHFRFESMFEKTLKHYQELIDLTYNSDAKNEVMEPNKEQEI